MGTGPECLNHQRRLKEQAKDASLTWRALAGRQLKRTPAPVAVPLQEAVRTQIMAEHAVVCRGLMRANAHVMLEVSLPPRPMRRGLEAARHSAT